MSDKDRRFYSLQYESYYKLAVVNVKCISIASAVCKRVQLERTKFNEIFIFKGIWTESFGSGAFRDAQAAVRSFVRLVSSRRFISGMRRSVNEFRGEILFRWRPRFVKRAGDRSGNRHTVTSGSSETEKRSRDPPTVLDTVRRPILRERCFKFKTHSFFFTRSVPFLQREMVP